MKKVLCGIIFVLSLLAILNLSDFNPTSDEYSMDTILARVHRAFLGSAYQRVLASNITQDLLLTNLMAVRRAWRTEHKKHQRRLRIYRISIQNSIDNCISTIAFGDSLLDGHRNNIDAVPFEYNFAIGGSWAHHMRQMAEDIHQVLIDTGKKDEVRYVIIGSLGGNPFLNGQPLKITIKESIKTLNTIRKLFPRQRIIIYGIPPTLNMYVNQNAIPFEKALINWARKDRDSVFLPLHKQFSGRFGIYPKDGMSIDGVHFTLKGVKEFNRLLHEAQKAKPGSIVD